VGKSERVTIIVGHLSSLKEGNMTNTHLVKTQTVCVWIIKQGLCDVVYTILWDLGLYKVKEYVGNTIYIYIYIYTHTHMHLTLMLLFSLNSPLNVEMVFCENIEVEVLKTFIIIAHYNLNNFTTNMTIYHRKLLLKIMKITIII
jgi:hypothetical protein